MSCKSGSLSFLEPSGPHRACYGTALALYGLLNLELGLCQYNLRIATLLVYNQRQKSVYEQLRIARIITWPVLPHCGLAGQKKTIQKKYSSIHRNIKTTPQESSLIPKTLYDRDRVQKLSLFFIHQCRKFIWNCDLGFWSARHASPQRYTNCKMYRHFHQHFVPSNLPAMSLRRQRYL